MQLQIPIPVSFELILETDKALIVKDIKINGDNFLSECNIPKMYATDLNEQKDGTYTANVEKWVLKQRKDETVNVNIEREIADLMETTDMSMDESLQSAQVVLFENGGYTCLIK
jgi:hypothetical protein